MGSQTSTSAAAAEASGANAMAGSNQHYAIQVDSVEQLLHANQQFVEDLLDRNWKDEQFLRVLDNYFEDTHNTMNFYAAVVQEYLDSANKYQSLIFQHGEEGSFNPLNISHHHFFHNLVSVYTQHLLMRDTLQSFQNDLPQKLHRVKFWTKVSAVAFTAAVVITSAAAASATATARNPAIAATTAAVPILLGTIGKWTLSLLRKYKDGVKKHVEIIRVMVVGANIIMNDLSSLHLSARRFELQTKSVSEIADSADACEVRKKLIESFQELQAKAADFCRDIRLARAFTLQSVIKHLDFITR